MRTGAPRVPHSVVSNLGCSCALQGALHKATGAHSPVGISRGSQMGLLVGPKKLWDNTISLPLLESKVVSLLLVLLTLLIL